MYNLLIYVSIFLLINIFCFALFKISYADYRRKKELKKIEQQQVKKLFK